MQGRTEQKRMHWQGRGAWQKGHASTACPALRSGSNSKHWECPPPICLLPASGQPARHLIRTAPAVQM